MPQSHTIVQEVAVGLSAAVSCSLPKAHAAFGML